MKIQDVIKLYAILLMMIKDYHKIKEHVGFKFFKNYIENNSVNYLLFSGLQQLIKKRGLSIENPINDISIKVFYTLLDSLELEYKRLKSDYRYSNSVVYNNFIFPNIDNDEITQALDITAQSIIDARMLYDTSSLASQYDPLTMPIELSKAHDANNKAVDKSYGYKGADDDASRVAFLFDLYEKAVNLLPTKK
jgi:hypothetical protein